MKNMLFLMLAVFLVSVPKVAMPVGGTCEYRVVVLDVELLLPCTYVVDLRNFGSRSHPVIFRERQGTSDGNIENSIVITPIDPAESERPLAEQMAAIGYETVQYGRCALYRRELEERNQSAVLVTANIVVSMIAPQYDLDRILGQLCVQ